MAQRSDRASLRPSLGTTYNSGTRSVHKIYNGTDTSELRTQSTAHMDIARRTCRGYLKHRTSGVCNPLLSTACLLAMHGLTVAQVDTPINPVAETCAQVRLFRGDRYVVNLFDYTLLKTDDGVDDGLMLEGVIDANLELLTVPQLTSFRTEILESYNIANQPPCLDAIEQLRIVITDLDPTDIT